jgi:hypothetical protein
MTDPLRRGPRGETAERDETRDANVAWVERLHAVVDELTEPVRRAHAGRLACRAGCAGCCQDDLTVFEIEAEVIRRRHPELLATGTPRATGGCAFLDDGGLCRVYDARPYVCRTQGLPLRWLDEDEQGETFEARDVCPLNLDGIALEELPTDELWTLGPIEQRLADRQGAASGPAARVALRSLFVQRATPGPAEDGATRKLPVVG